MQSAASSERASPIAMPTTSHAALGLAAAAGAAAIYLLLRRRADRWRHVDRRKVHTVKHTFSKGGGLLNLWVADMELECATHIVDALVRRAAHPTYGYTIQPEIIWERIAEWLVARQSWAHKPIAESFVFSANVVASFASALRALTAEGDAVVIMVPAYEPLQACVTGCGRRLVLHPLTRDHANGGGGQHHGGYSMDLPGLMRTLEREAPKALLLLNPHNPLGRVWTQSELSRLAAACADKGVLVISDEIWADWIVNTTHSKDGGRLTGIEERAYVYTAPCGMVGQDGRQKAASRFVPFASVAGRCRHLTLGGPTKTFNLAGLHCSYAIIEDTSMRRKFLSHVTPGTHHFGSVFATAALLAAYSDLKKSAEWLDGAIGHVRSNAVWLTCYLEEQLQKGGGSNGAARLIVPLRLDATYLMWLDCTNLVHRLKLKLPSGLDRFFVEECKLCLSAGHEFDPTGASDACMRINLACPRRMVEQAAERIRSAVGRALAASPPPVKNGSKKRAQLDLGAKNGAA